VVGRKGKGEVKIREGEKMKGEDTKKTTTTCLSKNTESLVLEEL